MGSAERSAPVGSVHPSGRCYECGARHTDQTMVKVKATNAWAWLCNDAVACLRRKRRAADGRQEKLFMRNPRPAA